MIKSIQELLANGGSMQKLNEKPFVFLEGPVWDKRRGRLYFSDPLDRTIVVMERQGVFRILADNTGYVNGMCLNGRGNLAVCNMENGTLDELCPDTGEIIGVIAAGYNNRPFNATNDVACDCKGGYYITDPFFTYGPRTQDTEATYYCSSAGLVTRVATDSIKPNGLALSPDGTRLYIDDTASTKVWSYAVMPDGDLAGARVFCNIETPENASELPAVQRFGEADGLKADEYGNVYVTTYTGIQVFSPDGHALGTIPMSGDESPANCEFGGDELRTLYVTARTSLYQIRLAAPEI